MKTIDFFRTTKTTPTAVYDSKRYAQQCKLLKETMHGPSNTQKSKISDLKLSTVRKRMISKKVHGDDACTTGLSEKRPSATLAWRENGTTVRAAGHAGLWISRRTLQRRTRSVKSQCQFPGPLDVTLYYLFLSLFYMYACMYV